MEVKFKVDIKTARKCFVILDMEIPSDDVIEEKLSKVILDLYGISDMEQALLGLTMMAIGEAFDESPQH